MRDDRDDVFYLPRCVGNAYNNTAKYSEMQMNLTEKYNLNTNGLAT